MGRCCCKYCSRGRFVVNSFCVKLLQYLNCCAWNDFHKAEHVCWVTCTCLNILED